MKIIIALLSSLFFPSFAHAYIDPGGIGAMLNLLVAGIVTSLFFLKETISNIYKETINFFVDLFVFFNFFKAKKSIVIYCENFQYLKYYGHILKDLAKENVSISLLIDKNNQQINTIQEVKKYFIKSTFLRNLSLSLLRCDILVLTTPDIGNAHVKKSKFCKHFFYIFHSAVSTQMVYKNFAFKNYDTICCNGDYQYNELLLEENNCNLPRKNLIKSGYPLFDTLNKDYIEKDNRGVFLVAPSWNPDIPDFYERYYSKILDNLLKENWNVIFRPHPEYYKRFSRHFTKFRDKYSSNVNVDFDDQATLIESFNKCETIITDWSGIAYEFFYFSKKFVIFNDVPVKKLNSKIDEIDEIFEYKYREKVGIIYKAEDDILNIVTRLREKNKDPKALKAGNDFFNDKFYNLGNASTKISNNIKDILKIIGMRK